MSLMATRGAENVRAPVENCTEFQIHVSQRMGKAAAELPIDFTEHRIKRLHSSETNMERRLELSALLADYRLGYVAIAWESGKLRYLKVTKS